jgi:chemotaxis protein MotA
MNLSSPLGIIFGAIVIGLAIKSEMSNASIFFNIHGLSIVFGGTFAAALVCFNFRQITDIIIVVFREMTGQAKKVRLETIQEIVALSEANLTGNLKNKISEISNHFLKESLILLMEGSFSHDELEEILRKRIQLQNEKYKKEGLTFKTIGKFPPAFGLIGATMGMIALLQGLGAPNAFEKLGPSMSVALTATFWGLVLANLFLIPIGENLSLAADEDLIIRRVVVDGVILLKEKKHPLLVEEYLKSYLPPRDRNNLRKAK